MTKLFDIIERISSRVSVRRMVLLLAVMLVGVNAWGEETVTLTCVNGTEFIENAGKYVVEDNSDPNYGKFVFSNHITLEDGKDHNPVVFKLCLMNENGTYGNVTEYSNNINLGKGSRGMRKYARFWWEVPDGYDIKVTRILISTRVYTSTHAMCALNQKADGSTGTQVNNVVGSNTDVVLLDATGIDKSKKGVLISYYYPLNDLFFGVDPSTGGRETYINKIEVSYVLTHTENVAFRHLDGEDWTYGHLQWEDTAQIDPNASTRVGDGTNIHISDNFTNILLDGNGSGEHSFVVHFQGIPDVLSFECKMKDNDPSTEQNFYVYESENGIDWGYSIFSQMLKNVSDNNKYVSVEIKLSPSTRFLKFVYQGKNDGGRFRNIRITELSQFNVEPSSIDFGKHGKDDGVFEEYIIFSHANAGDDVTVTSSNVAFQVYPTKVPNTGRDEMRSEYIKVSYIASTPGNHSGTITISDGSNSKTVSVSGRRVEKHVPVFTWNLREVAYYTNSSIENIFTTTNKDIEPEFEYDVHHRNGCVSVEKDENGRYSLVIGDTVSHQVTVMVSQDGDEDYWDSNSKMYSFTPREKPSLEVPFKIIGTDYTNAISKGNYECSSTGKPWWPSFRTEDKTISNPIEWVAGENGGAVRLGGSSVDWGEGPCGEYEDKYIIFEFAGEPDSLYFKYRTNYNSATGADWYVSESPDGKQWSTVWNARSSSRDYKESDEALPLKHSTRYLKFCYSGNFAGYFSNIIVTAYDGLYYLRNKNGKYLSRGGVDGTRACVDNYGIAVRKTRKTIDNAAEHTYTRFQYIDQFALNDKYLGLNEGNIYTNALSDFNFIEEIVAGSDSIRLLINGVAPIGLDYAWYLENVTEHISSMQQLKDQQAVAAATEFMVDVPTMAILKEQLFQNDYNRETIDLSSLGESVSTFQSLEQAFTSVDQVPFEIVVDTGLYCLSLKAFNRSTGNENAYTAYRNGYDDAVAYVYARDNHAEKRTQICSVFDFHSTDPTAGENYNPQNNVYFPANSVSAEAMLETGVRYENDVFIYVHEDVKGSGRGTLYFGFVSPSNGQCDNWVCRKNFTLTKFSRKEYTFMGVADNNWNNSANWEKASGEWDALPKLPHRVTLMHDVVINTSEAQAHTIILNGHTITINPDAALAVGEGGIVGATKDNLVLKANNTDNKGQTGALRLYPGTEAPEATVELYCKAIWDSENAVWQYIGSPLTKETVNYNERIFYKCWLYQWDNNGDWTNAGNWNKMEPFRGYAFTRDGQSVRPPYVFCGTLNEPSKTDVSLALTNYTTGENVFANSWTTPIDITKFEETDFVGVSQTLYIFNMGNGEEMSSTGSEGGQYLPIPIFTARDVGTLTTIPSMQGFVVRPKEEVESGAKLNLNYERLVWKNDECTTNAALRAPERRDSELRASGRRDPELQSRVCVHIMSADSLADHVYLLEKEGTGFARGYDDGYDAKKMFADGLPAIYTYDTIGKLAVSATDDVIGTYLGINTTASTTYTIRFSHVIGEGLGLRDLLTDSCVAITDSTTYTFTASGNTPNQIRFVVEEYVEPQSWNGGTSIDNVDAGGMRIWQADELLSITGAPRCSDVRLYNAEGKLIISEKFNGATTINLSALPKGVYVAMVNETNVKIMR